MSEQVSRTVTPTRRVRGSVTVPGDKSVSHRVAMLAAVAHGTSVIENFLASEDCLNTLLAMETLGAAVTREGTTVTVEGTAGALSQPAAALDLGNSGTGIRLLAGLLAGRPLNVELTGDASLRSRPMRRIREPLAKMGARVELTGQKGCAPMRILGSPLQGIRYVLPMASAQVKSCVLLAGLSAEGRTTVVEPQPTRDHTERVLTAMGVPVRVEGPEVTVEGCGQFPRLTAGKWHVPGDFSSAAFWMVAGAGRIGDRVRLADVGLNPRRTALLDVLRRMGAGVHVEMTEPHSGELEPTGTVTIEGRPLKATLVSGREIPNLIDELPLVAVLGAMAQGTTVIRDAAELRVKESDRIATTVGMLHSLGIRAEEQPDGMMIEGGPVGGATVLQSGGDHRIAMASAILALRADRAVCIEDTACVATSYPAFWDDLARISG